MTDAPVRAHVFVSGVVQGVGYRMSCLRAARGRVGGWVRNLDDGRVEAVFEGTAEAVERMISWCRTGPSAARVRNVEVTWETPQGEAGFDVTG